MAETASGLWNNMAIRNWRKFLLYVGSIILILSFFVDTKGIEAVYVRTFSAWTVLLGLILFMFEDITTLVRDHYRDRYKTGDVTPSKLEQFRMGLTYFVYFIYIMTFIIWVVFVFPILFRGG